MLCTVSKDDAPKSTEDDGPHLMSPECHVAPEMTP
jgi:hypothetical protein